MRADDLASEIEALGAMAAEEVGIADWPAVQTTCEAVIEMAQRLHDLASELGVDD